MHTGWKSRGGGPDVFAKIPRGIKAFMENCLGGPPISGFIAFLLTSVLKFAWGGGYCINPPCPPPGPPCASMSSTFLWLCHNLNLKRYFNLTHLTIIFSLQGPTNEGGTWQRGRRKWGVAGAARSSQQHSIGRKYEDQRAQVSLGWSIGGLAYPNKPSIKPKI